MGRKGSWSFAQHERERQKRKELNPIWRGVGCILIAVMGLAGYAFASWFLQQNAVNAWIYLPPQVFNPRVPSFLGFLGNGNLIRFVVALLFVLTAFGILNFVYALLFPVQPGEHDLPTPKRRPRRNR